MFYLEYSEISGKVKAFADIVNNHQRSYKIDKTSLITGNTPIVSSNTVARPLYMSTAMISSPTSSNFGTYSYSIIKSYTLLPQSVKTFPFITPTIVLNYRLEATTYLESTGVIDGLFQRLFSIRPSEFLPSGTVTFYQTNGFCLGQGTIPDTSKNFTQTIALGDDPDVHYTIQSVTTQVRQTPAYGQDLNITITVSNQKDQQIVSVKLELTSGYSNTTFVNKNRNCKIIQDQITQSLIFTTTLKPAQEEKCTITVSQTN
ncbi:unnamed protein product [Didymodactylos carnosus]|uniref:Uncharacterized protein n=1 Tax=Didymodactylos carnosus TaxID=1234261 RepID=A0A815JRL3_9BILA|nr:unnamed protein product [Didymodactylos carnosus]CAF1380182.1 unnamed protein product [Didymodactylos carnosus]CAF3828321.1 unnamed protein product [Didymodactylos carnosus]CAF4274143.1 unnamed protein product [Didymodactylos carnosus]